MAYTENSYWTTEVDLLALHRNAPDNEELTAAIAIVGNAAKQQSQWAACLRCSMAFPTSFDLTSHHYKIHGARSGFSLRSAGR